jgi:putative methionine-R-sulfoxide reductase with GAF domain
VREIKFRSWIKDQNRMIHRFGMDSPSKSETDRNALMQYTGLKDMNGKEIYEGDIINFYHSEGKELSSLGVEVVWKQEWCGFYFDDNRRLNNCMRIEVIGNKYENPEAEVEEISK